MKKIIISLCIVFLGIVVTPNSVFAAEVYFSSPTQNFKTGDKIYFDVFMDTEGQNSNAIEADIVFPQDLLEFVDYYGTGSVINGWVEVPASNGNSVHFAGIIAGGFSGLIDPVTSAVSAGRVTRLVFIAKKEGSGSLSFTEASVLANDGLGTPLHANTSPYEFSISNEGTPVADFSYDITPPEPFSPLVRRDERFYSGKYFIVFEAQDKETGIAYYKVKEGLRKWVVASSPYQLQDQSLTSVVRIVAVDKNGNEREARISLDQYPLSKAGLAVFIGLLVILIGVSIFAYVYTRKRK